MPEHSGEPRIEAWFWEIIEASGHSLRKLCRNLVELYDYMCRRLIEANTQQISAPLIEVERLLTDLSQAWQQASDDQSAEFSTPPSLAYADTGAACERVSYAY